MPPQPTHVPTYVHTLGGQRMVARQPNPQGAPSSVITAAADPLGLTANAPPTVQDQPVHTLSGRERGLSVPASGGVPQPGPNEQLAGSAFMPISAFLRYGGQGVNRAGQFVRAHPYPVAGGGGAAAASVPTEASPPQDSNGWPAAAWPRRRRVYDAVGSFTGLWGPKSDSQQPLTRDEFVNARRKLQPKTEADYIESEVDKVRGTERWKEGGQRLRENLESGARRNAKEAFAGYQRGVADETTRLVNDYNDYKTGWKTKRDELLN